ncbi:MAG: methyltransferase domain-containing protein [Actinomycetota bacterium]|jgi:trans-aconitate 2-methyltransferase|nr:methyltransferase domain-containing protein [Actinomycetota bacterium]MDA8358050.1 methyltransferase domain-containing protein [Actinomycetota bacterium]
MTEMVEGSDASTVSESDGQHGSDWDAVAYDRLADPQTRWGAAVVGWLELTGQETVLDAGCGSGRVTEQLLGRLPQGRVVALDASAAMLAHARTRLASHRQRVHFVETDLLGLGPTTLGEDAPVDAVLSTATFHWVTDHDRLFANLRTVMRPRAQLVAQCGAQGNLRALLDAVRSLGVERLGTWLYASPGETAVRLERAGFVDVHVWTNAEPTRFEDHVQLADFLAAVILREHLARLAPAERRPFVERVVAAMPEPVIDYVRLNLVARRGP